MSKQKERPSSPSDSAEDEGSEVLFRFAPSGGHCATRQQDAKFDARTFYLDDYLLQAAGEHACGHCAAAIDVPDGATGFDELLCPDCLRAARCNGLCSRCYGPLTAAGACTTGNAHRLGRAVRQGRGR